MPPCCSWWPWLRAGAPATGWLLQKGSPESEELDEPGRETDTEQTVGRGPTPRPGPPPAGGGRRVAVYSERGSSQSKPVGEPHGSTGVEG